MIYAGILAGGTGTRMGIQEMPKQFLPLGNKPIIIHTVEKFLFVPDVDVVYVAVHPNWVSYFNDLLDKHDFLRLESEFPISFGRLLKVYNKFNEFEKKGKEHAGVRTVRHPCHYELR